MAFLAATWVARVERDLIAERSASALKTLAPQLPFVGAFLALDVSRRLAISRALVISLFMIRLQFAAMTAFSQPFQIFPPASSGSLAMR
jgi:hypothetical protein